MSNLRGIPVEQDKQVFTQQIVTQVTLFEMMRDQVSLAAEADSIASEKYQIARERYVLGNLSITDLSIAFQEKDQAKRDYVAALRNLWGLITSCVIFRCTILKGKKKLFTDKKDDHDLFGEDRKSLPDRYGETLALNSISLEVGRVNSFPLWALRVAGRVRCSISWDC